MRLSYQPSAGLSFDRQSPILSSSPASACRGCVISVFSAFARVFAAELFGKKPSLQFSG